MARNPLRFVPLVLVCAAGCDQGTVDISASRGDLHLHFGGAGCGQSYTGNTAIGPSAIDITCPFTLHASEPAPAFHLSTPLVLKAGPSGQPIEDPQFQQRGSQLGQFVVVSFPQGGTQVVCDPRQASGVVAYGAVPSAQGGGRLNGYFSHDAALRHCSDGGPPLVLQGTFDLPVPPGI